MHGRAECSGRKRTKSSLYRPYPPPRQRLVLLAHFTGYRLQTTATTSGLLGHKRPLSLPTGSWLQDQGAITLAFLSLVLWFLGQRVPSSPAFLSEKIVKRLSIFAIKKKEPADYEPPHSAGIAYPSLKIIQYMYGIVLHINIFVPFSHLVIMMISSMVILICLRVEKLNR